MVRPRDDEEGLDSLRLYGRYSNPLHHFRSFPAPWSNDWSIEQGGSFLIFYIRIKPLVPMPPNPPPEFPRPKSPGRELFSQRVLEELLQAGTEDGQGQSEGADEDKDDSTLSL